MGIKVNIPRPGPDLAAAKAQVVEALAQVRGAMLLAEEQEMNHSLAALEPPTPAQTATDAAVRNALLSSEDAMIQVLQTLPPTPPGTLVN